MVVPTDFAKANPIFIRIDGKIVGIGGKAPLRPEATAEQYAKFRAMKDDTLYTKVVGSTDAKPAKVTPTVEKGD